MLLCLSGRSSAIDEDEGAAAVVAARFSPLWLRSHKTSGRQRHCPATRIVHAAGASKDERQWPSDRSNTSLGSTMLGWLTHTVKMLASMCRWPPLLYSVVRFELQRSSQLHLRSWHENLGSPTTFFRISSIFILMFVSKYPDSFPFV
jgi:hypothetical protein